ncbi:hypothetical protein [uncultured Bacteroides sp.]|uniref:hypothetical protein n=1 Tax=uncultured Bacteroides sp. TaxID=162156 RepID=UPI002598B2D4|nr:hypothetical protein [uncultured Bacteroides sp.]
MEHLKELSEIFSIIGGIVTTIILPLFGILFLREAKKRKAYAEARQAEADARKADADSISSYAAEWKKNYEEEKATVLRLDEKIDKLYAEKEEDRKHIRELMEKNTELALRCQMLEVIKCKIRGCANREPPSDY